jgi:hypothetical protein
MTQTDSNKPPHDEESRSKSPRSSDQHSVTKAIATGGATLFQTVIGLPSAIYNRGNEHGREFSRMYRDNREEVEESPQRREDRVCRSQRGANDKAATEEDEGQGNEADWIAKILEEMTKSEEQAKWLYKQFREEGYNTENGQAPPNREESDAGKVDKPHDALIRDVDDTIERLHQNVERWLGDAEKWTRQVQDVVERDSRLWKQQGLFGPDIPFSGPLSTMFSLGMKPLLPQESAIGYLLHSEYSPLHLEHEEGFDESWRLRFEDLLRAQDGKGILNGAEAEKAATSSGVEWINRVIPLLKDSKNSSRGRITIGSTSHQHPVVQVEEPPSPTQPATQAEEAGSGPETEMELYERRFGFNSGVEYAAPAQSAEEARLAASSPEAEMDLYERHLDFNVGVQRPTHSPSAKESSDLEVSKLSILSTLTTTERHVAADGSITTKRVLKKRFADGREEISESLETLPGNGAAWEEDVRPVRAEQRAPESQPKSRGWFWTS